MFGFLYPDLYARDIFSLPYNKLKKQNISALLIDIDNTLAPHYIKTPPESVIKKLEYLNSIGFKICILSNGPKRRVKKFMQGLPYSCVHRAGKPFSRGINKALSLLNAKKENAAIIGDQIFTDILAGKLNKVYTVLVKPISMKDEFFVAIKRYPERVVINEYKKHRAYIN